MVLPLSGPSYKYRAWSPLRGFKAGFSTSEGVSPDLAGRQLWRQNEAAEGTGHRGPGPAPVLTSRVAVCERGLGRWSSGPLLGLRVCDDLLIPETRTFLTQSFCSNFKNSFLLIQMV